MRGYYIQHILRTAVNGYPLLDPCRLVRQVKQFCG
jgi:hypothetical protein